MRREASRACAAGPAIRRFFQYNKLYLLSITRNPPSKLIDLASKFANGIAIAQVNFNF
jgi:hypothetical protein